MNQETQAPFKKNQKDKRDKEEQYQDEYMIYLKHADNGQGLDVTNNLEPLKSYAQWAEG